MSIDEIRAQIPSEFRYSRLSYQDAGLTFEDSKKTEIELCPMAYLHENALPCLLLRAGQVGNMFSNHRVFVDLHGSTEIARSEGAQIEPIGLQQGHCSGRSDDEYRNQDHGEKNGNRKCSRKATDEI